MMKTKTLPTLVAVACSIVVAAPALGQEQQPPDSSQNTPNIEQDSGAGPALTLASKTCCGG